MGHRSKWILLIFSSLETVHMNKYRALFDKSERETNEKVSYSQILQWVMEISIETRNSLKNQQLE